MSPPALLIGQRWSRDFIQLQRRLGTQHPCVEKQASTTGGHSQLCSPGSPRPSCPRSQHHPSPRLWWLLALGRRPPAAPVTMLLVPEACCPHPLVPICPPHHMDSSPSQSLPCSVSPPEGALPTSHCALPMTCCPQHRRLDQGWPLSPWTPWWPHVASLPPPLAREASFRMDMVPQSAPSQGAGL